METTMNKAIDTHTLRSEPPLMSGKTAMALLGTVDQISRKAMPASHPDAELIRLCTEIDRIEDQWLSTLPVGGDIPDTVAAGISAQQEPLIEQICDMTASTLNGMRARARTIVKWAPDLVSMSHDAADDMVAALLRDLIGEARV
jgi:hypothetical protein